jgi:hypothetical protein
MHNHRTPEHRETHLLAMVKAVAKVVDEEETVAVAAMIKRLNNRAATTAIASTRASTCGSALKTASISTTLMSPAGNKSTTQRTVSRAYASSPASSGA